MRSYSLRVLFVFSSYSHGILMVFSWYSHGILHVFLGGSLRGATAAPRNHRRVPLIGLEMGKAFRQSYRDYNLLGNREKC